MEFLVRLLLSAASYAAIMPWDCVFSDKQADATNDVLRFVDRG